MTEPFLIRDIEADDVEWLLALNNASTPHVNALSRSDLDALLDNAAYARLGMAGGDRAGALIAFWPGLDYDSVHYRWFSETFQSFLYVDRVVIAERAKGLGLGRAIYDDLESFAADHAAPMIALEVNRHPPNPRSMAFHERLGFTSVGELAHEDSDKRVVLMTKKLKGG
jgi:predicted GNAT superfamily acetyltransferase